MMMLFTPSWSMKLIISFCAPAVMDSIATTAPTPKIMPSMVSRLRSLCANRLAKPIFNSGRMCEIPMLFRPRQRAHGVALGFLVAVFLAGSAGSGVRQRHNIARLDAGSQHHQRFALLDQLHFARLKLAVLLLHEDGRLAVLLENRLRRNVQGVGNFFDFDLDV